jgi:hypothetical protein
MKRVALALAILTVPCPAAVQPDMSLSVLATDRPTSFRPLLRLQISNRAYTPVDLGELITNSALILDGKRLSWSAADFTGPAGLPAQGSWDGCVAFEDYGAEPAPGRHRVQLLLGGSLSPEVDVKMPPAVNWRKGTLNTRMAEIKEMASNLKKGLPRTCVERWLPEIDGGVEEARRVRYYLEPGVKVVVPYTEPPTGGRANEVVSGKPEVYQEPHLAD